jgi:hypothetical protein
MQTRNPMQQPEHESCIADRIRVSLEAHGSQVKPWHLYGDIHMMDYLDTQTGKDHLKATVDVAIAFNKQIRGDGRATNYGSYPPRTIAATLMYMAAVVSGYNASMSTVGEAFNTNSSTISKHFHKLKHLLYIKEDEEIYRIAKKWNPDSQ